MGLMNTVMAGHSAAICDVDKFGESITYRPVGGANQEMVGIVLRGQLVDTGNGYDGRVTELHLLIPIGPAPIGRPSIGSDKNELGDSVFIVEQVGKPARWMPVNGVIGQVGGMWKLRIG